MNKYAVAYISFFTNILKLNLVSADSVQEAIFAHEDLQEKDMQEWLADMPESLEEIKEYFYDSDACIDVIEISKQ